MNLMTVYNRVMTASTSLHLAHGCLQVADHFATPLLDLSRVRLLAICFPLLRQLLSVHAYIALCSLLSRVSPNRHLKMLCVFVRKSSLQGQRVGSPRCCMTGRQRSWHTGGRLLCLSSPVT